MSNNKINSTFVIMLIGIFIISISAADEHWNQNDIDKYEIAFKNYKELPKIESNLLKADSDIFKSQFQDNNIIKVVINLNSNNELYIQSLENNGANIEAVYENLVQATVPVSELTAISQQPFVKYIRSPYKLSIDEVSEGVDVINASLFHDEGFKGQGVKIAILDGGFAGYQSRLGTELPNTVMIKSFCEGGIDSGGISHGTAVAEVVHDTAPDASLYLINFDTEINFSQAVNYAISQDVDIISMSVGWPIGPFNGTGLINEIVETATSSGIIWVNSAGNYAQKHWEGTFNDTNSNEIHNFFNDDETMSIVIPSGGSGDIEICLSWDDWPESDQDYDLHLYSNTGKLLTSSVNVQNGIQEPFEKIIGIYSPGTYNLVIEKYNATRDVHFELYSNYQDLEYKVTSSSLGIPADAQEVIAVGATYWSNDVLESFSSQGPTNDGRIKPDLVAPNGVSTSVPGYLSFYGTSASVPHVAGASALLLQVNPNLSPDQLKQILENGSIDMGEPGKDNQYGAGRIDVYMVLPGITFVYPTPESGSTISHNWMFVNVTSNEPLDTALLEWNGINESMSGGTTNWYRNKTTLVDGIHNFKVWGQDSTGEWIVSETRSVTIDTSPPDKLVLIIDDDNDIHFGDDQSVDRFNSTFESLGYDVVIEESANTSNSTWDDYDILIWSCGDDFTPVYNPEYKEMLIEYVTSGGNLILESGNIATWIDRFGVTKTDMEFRNIVLHATSDWVYCDVGNLTFNIQHPLATTLNLLPETINFTPTDPDDDSSDADAVRILPNATSVYNWSDINYEGNLVNINTSGLIIYDDDTDENNGGQIIYYAFDIDDIDDPDVQRKIIENSEHWLKRVPIPKITGFGPSSPVNDTAPATRSFNITVDQILNVTWYFNTELQEQDNLTTVANVTITTQLHGVHNVTAITRNENGTAVQKWNWNVTKDILSYYTSLGSDPNVVETTDLLTVADDWKNNITPPGFDSPITTQQLLILADEWSSS